MTTALDIITRAMRLSTVIGKGEIPDDDEAQDGLTSLNDMLDGWQIERNFVYQVQEEPFTWTANQQTRTVGAAGDFVTSMPTRIDEASSFTIDSIDYPVTFIDVDAWSAIPDKTTTSTWPWWMYAEYGAALVTLYAYPIPSANITFNLRSWKQLQQFSTLTTDLALPPGNRRAVTFSLAEEYCSEFGIDVPPRVARIASSSRRALKRINSWTPVMSSEVGYISRRTTTGYIYGGIT